MWLNGDNSRILEEEGRGIAVGVMIFIIWGGGMVGGSMMGCWVGGSRIGLFFLVVPGQEEGAREGSRIRMIVGLGLGRRMRTCQGRSLGVRLGGRGIYLGRGGWICSLGGGG